MMKSNKQSPRILLRARNLVRRITFSAARNTDIQAESPVSVLQPSPIDILPIDVLREIFVAFVSFDVTPPRNREVLCISQVSSVWRKAAIGTSELWSSLAISIAHLPHYGGSGRRGTTHTSWKFVKTWLERSEGRDLSLSIQGVAPSLPDTGSSCPGCLKLLEIVFIPHARRICYLHGLTTHLLAGLAHQPLPSLRSLIFHPESIIPTTSIPFLRTLAPNLRRLRVHFWKRRLLVAPQTRAMLPYVKQLTHLITCADGHMVTEIFQTFSNLEAIVLYYQHFSRLGPFARDDDTHEIFLPKLSSLTIVLLNKRPLDLSMFRFLKMPALQTFRLGSFHEVEFSFYSELPTDLHRGYEQIASIRRLSFFFDYLAREPGMERFFSNIPDLEELDIQDCLDYEIFFARLNCYRNECLVHAQLPILPRLRILTLDIRQMNDFELEDPHFVEFITTQLVLEPLFRALVYVSGNARAIYVPMVGMAKEQGLPIDLVVWDEKFGSRGDKWKYRMQGEVERWATEGSE